jgi:aminopeptidase N
MDEGFNELLNYYSWTKRFGKPPTHRASRQDYLAMATSGMEKPIMTAPDQLSPHFVSPAAYDKPSLALRLLREFVIGPERFDAAFKEYYRRWAYKHPTPADFFRTIENVAGEDLSWFWRSWFFTTQQLDQAVDSVTVADSAGAESRIHLRNAGQIPMPVDLALIMDDGSTERLRLPVEIWFHGDRFTALVPGPRRVQSVRLDPEGQYPDVDPGNNEWRGAARTNTP